MRSTTRVLVAVAALVFATSVPVDAQPPRDRALELAQATVHEAGLTAHPDEVAAIGAVISERCNGSVRCQMPRFSRGITSRPWCRWLRRDGSIPRHWPRGVSWSARRDAWLSLLAVADEVIAGTRTATCAPEAWGGSVDAERAARLRLVEVDCGETRNVFYRFPERGPS